MTLHSPHRLRILSHRLTVAPHHSQGVLRDALVKGMDLAASLAAYERCPTEAPFQIPAASLCLGMAVHALRHRFPALLQETVPGLLAADGSLHLLRGEPDALYARGLGLRAATRVGAGGRGERALLKSLVARASMVITDRATHVVLFEPGPELVLAPVLFRKADVDWCTRRLGWPETVVAERVLTVATVISRGLGSQRVPSYSTPVSSRSFRREALAVFEQPPGACGACGATRGLLPCPGCCRASHCDDACRRADLTHLGRCADLFKADHVYPQPASVEAMLADVPDDGTWSCKAFGSPIVSVP